MNATVIAKSAATRQPGAHDVIVRSAATKQPQADVVIARSPATKQSRATRTLFPALLALLLAGCGTSPPVSYFTLPSEPAQPASTPREYSIAVGPVTVPDAVDRPQLVLRTSETQVEVVERARWAAPLKHEIPRVIARELARLLPTAATVTSADRAGPAPDYRVLIDIQRFDSAHNDSATIEAAWTVRGPGAVLRSGRSVATEKAGAGYTGLVEAHGRALGAVSRDIAAAITALRR